MKPQQVRDLDEQELKAQVHEIQEQLFRLRFQMSMGQTDGLKKYRDAKKDRARMLGILRERELDPAKAQAAAEAAAKKPAETRMGKGKGAPEEWVCVIRPGRILFEMEGVAPDVAKEAMRLAAMKLPLPTKLVTREFEGA